MTYAKSHDFEESVTIADETVQKLEIKNPTSQF